MIAGIAEGRVRGLYKVAGSGVHHRRVVRFMVSFQSIDQLIYIPRMNILIFSAVDKKEFGIWFLYLQHECVNLPSVKCISIVYENDFILIIIEWLIVEAKQHIFWQLIMLPRLY